MTTENNRTPFIIDGGKHSDKRGEISYVNDFSLHKIKRFYTISHPRTNIVRAWQGHKNFPKYFYPIIGSFWIACVQIDNWLNPSANLKVDIFKLVSTKSSVLYIPAGFANGLKAIEDDSKLISFCEDDMNESLDDDFRFNHDMWLDWDSLK